MSQPNMFDIIRQRNMQDYEDARALRAFDPTFNREITATQILQDVKAPVEVIPEILPEQAPVEEHDALDVQELPPEGVTIPEPVVTRRKRASKPVEEPTPEPMVEETPEPTTGE